MQYCNKCNEHFDDKYKFCPHCGGPAVSSPIVNTPYVFVPPPEQNAQQKKKLSKKSLIIISSCAAAFVLVLFGVIYLSNQANKSSFYDEAINLMASGNYGEARDIFVDLGSYKDSYELVVESQKMLDYNAAGQLMERGNYKDAKAAFEVLGAFRDSSALASECQMLLDYDLAKQLMDNGSYSEAKTAFQALGDFKDSNKMAMECQSEMNYSSAMELMIAEEYEKASEMFIVLGSYKNSASLALECANWIDYWLARNLMDQGRYNDAWPILEPLKSIDFEDSYDHFYYCITVLLYDDAEKAYEEGRFYTAYGLFNLIDHYEDSADRAVQCIQSLPSTGQIYRNKDFPGSSVSLKVKTPKDDPRPTFLKIYTEDGTHVSSIFIRSGGSPTVKLPPNTYIIRSAFGANWFGPDEMFGDEDAVYQTLILDGGTAYAFKRNYIYTLTLRSSALENANVGTEGVSRTGF